MVKTTVNGVKKQEVELTTDPDVCVHYWIVDPPRGTMSKAVCNKCGEHNEFPNHMPAEVTPWRQNMTLKGRNKPKEDAR